MSSTRSPQEINTEILSKLDVLAEYRALGVRTSGQVRQSGMISCYAWGRDDARPSAYINVRTGIYGDSGGDNTGHGTCSLWDFAVKVGKYPDWKEARKAYAAKVGVAIGKERKPAGTDWREKLELQPWSTPGNDVFVKVWCAKHKPGVTIEAIQAAGGVLAYHPCWVDRKTGELHRGRNQVVAIPCYGPYLLDADPVAYVIWDINGNPFDTSPRDHPKDQPRLLSKMISVGPTAGTVMGLSSLMLLSDPERRKNVQLVWKVEGPADMLALWAALPPELREIVAIITNASGAAADVHPHQAKLLAGLRLAVCGDCDEAGQVGASKWLRSVEGLTIESRKVILPWEILRAHGKDVRDFLTGEPLVEGQEKTPRTYADLLAIHDATAAWVNPDAKDQPAVAVAAVSPQPAPPAPPADPAPGEPAPTVATAEATEGPPALANPAEPTSRELDFFIDNQVARDLQIDVMGRTEDGGVRIYSEFQRTTITLKNLSRMKYSDLLQHFGTPVKRRVSQGKNEDATPGMHTVTAVINAISHLASARMLNDETELGLGCWPIDEDDNHSIILVNKDEALHYNGTVERVTHPRLRNQLLSFESGANPWYKFETMQELLEQAKDVGFRNDVVDQLYRLWSQWRWNGTHDPMLMSGLVLATWVQTLWTWRPRVDILGASNTGKSYLCRALAGIFRDCVIMTSDTTAAGLRQKIRNSAVAVVVDEVDAKNKAKMMRQREILEMLRSASRGTAAIRGSGSQKAIEFTLRHLVWVAGIALPYDDAADRNRAIILNLLPPLPEMAGKLSLPFPGVLSELGQKSLAVALWSVQEARLQAEVLKQTKVEGIDNRLIESYAVPASILAAALSLGDGFGEGLLRQMLDDTRKDPPPEKDETNLISEILTAKVRLGQFQLTIGQAIEHVCCIANTNREEWRQALEGVGIKIDWADQGSLIFQYQAVKKLMRGTRWEDQPIDQYLRRVDSIQHETAIRRVGGSRGRSVIYNLHEFRGVFIGEDNSSAGPKEF